MKRRFNYTGRKKIKRENIKLKINTGPSSIKSISANVNIDQKSFPPETKVYLDAYHKFERKRFDFGSVKELKIPYALQINDLSFVENLRFRLLLVDKNVTNGKILAHSDSITIDESADIKPILPVKFDDIGNVLWQLRFTGEIGGPVLFVNEKIPNIETIVKTDVLFFNYVFPQAIKEIMYYMVFVDGVDDIKDPSIDWHKDWLLFFRKFLPNEPFPETLQPLDENFNREDVIKFFDEVVLEFSSHHSVKWEEIIKKFEGE